MPDLEIDWILFDEDITVTEIEADGLGLEIDFTPTAGTGDITDIEMVEVIIPEKFQFEGTVKNEGNVAGLMLLEAAAPVPPGTPVGTVILRKP